MRPRSLMLPAGWSSMATAPSATLTTLAFIQRRRLISCPSLRAPASLASMNKDGVKKRV